MNKNEVLNSLQNLSSDLLSDKETLEKTALSMSYEIDLSSVFQDIFEKKLHELYPVTNYAYCERKSDYYININNVKNISDRMLFIICNPELYTVNRCNCIEKIDEKNLTVKILFHSQNFIELLKVNKISIINFSEQKNRKVLYTFDKENFDKLMQVLTYSNEYTEEALNNINEYDKERYNNNASYPDILSRFWTQKEIDMKFDYINRFLLRKALKS